MFQAAGVVMRAGMLLAVRKNAVLANEAAGEKLKNVRLRFNSALSDSLNRHSTSADRRARIAMWNAERESGGPS